MSKPDQRIDAYIDKAEPFAKPILKHLRKLIHKGCPEVEETIKWGMPSFDYKGPFISMASFKQHAVFGFWKAQLLKDPKKYLEERAAQGGEAMGHLGRITSLKDLPPDDVIVNFVKQAKKLNDDGVKVPPRVKKEKSELEVPVYFIKELKKNKPAAKHFDAFSESKKREYVEWIIGAKTDSTRVKRMTTAVEWIADGKSINWRYERK